MLRYQIKSKRGSDIRETQSHPKFTRTCCLNLLWLCNNTKFTMTSRDQGLGDRDREGWGQIHSFHTPVSLVPLAKVSPFLPAENHSKIKTTVGFTHSIQNFTLNFHFISNADSKTPKLSPTHSFSSSRSSKETRTVAVGVSPSSFIRFPCFITPV